MTPTMSATSATETMPLSDEAILGIESESSRGADGNDSRSDADAIDAEFASRETAPGAENRAHEERDATGREARREESDAAGRDSREENRAARRDGKDGDRSARQQRDDASEQKATPQRDANAERTLPLTSLAEFDAGFYSGDAASRTALAQSLFSSDPAAFRAMFDEAARLLGVTASRGENIANAANGNGAVAEASATADRFRPPAVPAQNQDGGLPTRSGQLPASATQTDHGMRDENAATNDARNNASRNDASQNAARGEYRLRRDPESSPGRRVPRRRRHRCQRPRPARPAAPKSRRAHHLDRDLVDHDLEQYLKYDREAGRARRPRPRRRA